MIIVRIEIFALGDIDTERWLIIVTSQDVEEIVDSTRSKSDLRKINGPDTTIGVLTLYLNKRLIGLNMNV